MPLSREPPDNDRGELTDGARGEPPDGAREELPDGDEDLPNRRRVLRTDPRTPPAPLLHSRDP